MTDTTAWKLVPVEPSEAMVNAGVNTWWQTSGYISDRMRAAITAAIGIAPSPSPLTDAEILELQALTLNAHDIPIRAQVLAFARAVERVLMEGK